MYLSDDSVRPNKSSASFPHQRDAAVGSSVLCKCYSETLHRPYLTFREQSGMTDVWGCASLAVGLSGCISLLSHFHSGSELLAGYFNHTTLSPFTSNFGKLFIILFADNPSSLLSSSLTLYPSFSRLLSWFTPAGSLLISLSVFTVTQLVSLNLNHSYMRILSSSGFHCTTHPQQSYPFAVSAIAQADTEIPV